MGEILSRQSSYTERYHLLVDTRSFLLSNYECNQDIACTYARYNKCFTGSPGLLVMGGDSCYEFRFHHHILDGHFFA